MIESIVIVMFALMMLSALFIIGYFMGLSDGLNMTEDYSINEVCPHWIAETRTISVECGCETTQLLCTQCGEALQPPKTEC